MRTNSAVHVLPVLLSLIVVLSWLGQPSAIEASGAFVETMESAATVAQFDSDQTGAVFQQSQDFVFQGEYSLKIIPSGRSEETKLAMRITGDQIRAFEHVTKLLLSVYLPEQNLQHPTMFFLGVANVTAGWEWVDGVFGGTSVNPGWNIVEYILSPRLQDLKPDDTYILYFAFAGFDAKANKVPLTEPFYVDAIWVDQGLRRPTREELIAAAPDHAKADVVAISLLDDEALLDMIARRAFDYFWYEVNPRTGLIRDRNTANSPASIAAVGFGLSAIPIGIERGWISHEEGYERALTTLKTFAHGGVEGKRGFFFHFVHLETGGRAWASELSSIDTALFIAGALTAAGYFAGTEVATLADDLYQATDWLWMMNGRSTLSMGWKPESGFLNAHWTHFDEGLLLYVLAIASPQHPISVAAWDAFVRPVEDGAIVAPGDVLFTYQFPLAWLDLRDREDAYANYWNNAIQGATRNRLFTWVRRSAYETYDMQVWGLSASDGPAGYKAYGARDGNHDGTIAPYASAASLPLVPDVALQSIRSMLLNYGPLVWGPYGFVSAFNAEVDWYSGEYIGIDLGITLLMIENYRTGLIWKLFMKNSNILDALQKIGFKVQPAPYAVTPRYEAIYRGFTSL